MFDLTRLTCAYIDREDRIRCVGETANGTTVVVWMTQRLLIRLIPPICQWLENSSAVSDAASHLPDQSVLWQGFAQQAAQADMTPQPAVRLQAGAPEWLVFEVDMSTNADCISLSFKGEERIPPPSTHIKALADLIASTRPQAVARVARMAMTVVQARQWLGIVHQQCRQASWALPVWPEWIEEAQSFGATDQAPPSAMLH